MIGVRGQIRTSSYETENGEKKYQTEVVVEKVSFLSSKPIEEEKPNSGKK